MKKMLIIIALLLVSVNIFSEKWREYVPDKYEEFLEYHCIKYNLPVDVVVAIGTVESNWRNVRGYTGDIGLFQLNKWYISYYEEKFWVRKESFNPWNPYHNIELSVKYIHWIYQLTKENWEHTIKAYNVGLTKLRNKIEVYPTYADPYYFKVINVLSSL